MANLGQNCTEEELIQVFSRQGSNSHSRCNVLLILFSIKKYYAADSFFPSLSVRCPGFLKLKMQSTYGAPVAFVDFQVLDCSSSFSLSPSILLSFSDSILLKQPN